MSKRSKENKWALSNYDINGLLITRQIEANYIEINETGGLEFRDSKGELIQAFTSNAWSEVQKLS